MSIGGTTDVEAFYAFLGDQIAHGSSSKSPELLLDQWRTQREIEVAAAAAEDGYADGEAGRMVLARDLLAQKPKAGSE